MYSNGREIGEFAIKQEENAAGVDACVGHVKPVEVKYENEYLKSQLVGQSNLHFASDGHARLREIQVQGNGTREQIESLNRELLLEKQTRNAAEEALKHLQEVYSKADTKVQEITIRLAEAQQKMNQEMLARGGKNAEPTLNRLHEHGQKVQNAQSAPENEKQAQPQIQAQRKLSPVCPPASSGSSSSDSSSDESKNEHGEPSNAIPNATLENEEPWTWLEDWISEESDDYPAMLALTELLRHAVKVSKQVKDLKSVNPYRSSRAILHGSHHERAWAMMREMMRKKVWNFLGMKLITGLLRHAEQL